jgi:hypothetical protein
MRYDGKTRDRETIWVEAYLPVNFCISTTTMGLAGLPSVVYRKNAYSEGQLRVNIAGQDDVVAGGQMGHVHNVLSMVDKRDGFVPAHKGVCR